MAPPSSTDNILQDHIRKRFQYNQYPEAWRNLPEVPSSDEIKPSAPNTVEPVSDEERENSWNEYQLEPSNLNLPHNIVDGAWPSKMDYVGAHYRILREDAIAPLRQSVQAFSEDPNMVDDVSTCIYTGVSQPTPFQVALACINFRQVTFKGLKLSPIGAAFRVEFSHERSGKQIRWEQSKRLLQGSIVALSPEGDNFRKICKIAVIAARPIIGGLDQNPPTVDLFWGDSDEAVFDPAESESHHPCKEYF